jgi:endonuclease YncB( thermonuclease family)
MRPLQRTLTAASALSVLVIVAAVSPVAAGPTAASFYRVDHVVDGDTIALRNGQRVRLVQIDTGPHCNPFPDTPIGQQPHDRAAFVAEDFGAAARLTVVK